MLLSFDFDYPFGIFKLFFCVIGFQDKPTDAWRFWDIYHAVLKETEYEYFNRSLIHQSE
jgi:hypothetical protein